MGGISTEDEDHTINSYNSSTNWTISGGSLHNCITFDSSLDSDSTQISPIILHRPSPDSPPCEIKLCFMQKHEIRQVYVRSTARVYEIYYAPTLQSDNEYLCTVRCTIAERDGEFLQAGGTDVGKPADGRVAAEAKLCSSEDDWVEVKVPDSPIAGNTVSCPQKHTIGNEGRSVEDLYEATAQISDTDPCMSITIRFLSLQNKGSVCIDEVYIFGDPIDSDETETPAVPIGNQASSFMAMLVPTLLQLSKSGVSQKQDKDVFDSQKKEEKVEIAARTSDCADAKKENDLEKRMGADHLVQLDVTDKPIAEPTHFQPLTNQNLSGDNHNISTLNTDESPARIERALEQLLDRVSRIENICLKFEENMVIPMNSMEMRLKQLEQQVEILAKNSEQSGAAPCTKIRAPSFTCSESSASSSYNDGSEYQPHGEVLEKTDLPCNKSFTRITAPSFTCSEPNSSSLYNDGSKYQLSRASEMEKKDTPCSKLSNLSDDMPVSSNTAHSVPNLVITAPEFSCGEDEKENDESEYQPSRASEMEKDTPCNKLSDSSGGMPVSSNTSHVVPNLVITAPEFSCEDKKENDIVESAKGSSQVMQKQVLSIDDALAAALSGLMSTSHVLPPDNGTSKVIARGSTSEEVNEKNESSQPAQSASVTSHDCTLDENNNDRPSKYTQILAIAAPDFSEEEYELESPTAPELASEEDRNIEIASPSTGSQDPRGFIDLNRSKSMHDGSSIVASEPYSEQEKFLHENVQLKGTSGIIGPKDHLYASQDDATACPSDQDDKVAESNPRDSTNEPQMNSHNENATESEEHGASKGSHVDVMQNVCEYVTPSTVDFDIPILDVKFAGNEDGDAKFSLEVLLGGMAEVNVEAPSADENADNGVTSEGITFTGVEELPKCSGGNGNPLLDYGTYTADTFTSLDGCSNPNTSSNQEVFIGLL